MMQKQTTHQHAAIHLYLLLQAQVVDVSLANGVSEDVPSGANASELGGGLTMDGGIAQRLFQFQLTGARHQWNDNMHPIWLCGLM